MLTKQTTFTPFAMHNIVSKVNNNALLVQTVFCIRNEAMR